MYPAETFCWELTTCSLRSGLQRGSCVSSDEANRTSKGIPRDDARGSQLRKALGKTPRKAQRQRGNKARCEQAVVSGRADETSMRKPWSLVILGCLCCRPRDARPWPWPGEEGWMDGWAASGHNREQTHRQLQPRTIERDTLPRLPQHHDPCLTIAFQQSLRYRFLPPVALPSL